VIDVSKKYLPSMSNGFDDPRVEVFVGDGFEFLKNHKKTFDVIIVDSSDPVGPAESLYQQPFYCLMKESLCPGGIVCTQAECQWLHLDLIKNLMDFSKPLFNHVNYAYTCIPSYPCGQIGFLLGSMRENDCKVPLRRLDGAILNYYSEEIHRSAFVLPEFARRKLCS